MVLLRTVNNLSRRCLANCIKYNNGSASSLTRCYRGDSSDPEQFLSEKEQKLLKTAISRSEVVMERHTRFPKLSEIPKSSLDPDKSTEDMELDVRRKRLVYRSKQRGWLEVDLLLGTWAAKNVSKLCLEELDEYEAFVNMETIDIYNIVTLRLDIPDDLKTESGNSVIERIQKWARASPLGKADPETYKAIKTANNLICEKQNLLTEHLKEREINPDKSTEDMELDVRRKRLVYRSKQRGWLEVDLLLGTWAAKNVSKLCLSELDEYEAFVNMETIDIYNIVTLRLDIPDDLKTESGNSVIERIQKWARASPLGKADPETYKAIKTANNLI
eukprot:CAMPEP_0194197376 /NCGR_PEP_ID=MMETSP0154-20130528/77168_1 /TAXON_ID=1049557 /ORGANISM="Thalassiothrix antarctica, Strain L6-D1" /LENGTH=330 /DNA_ID=CAMNT_0038922037 /DNA_START=60 /DNA_END=1054 /DNA_ORIENTATION=-